MAIPKHNRMARKFPILILLILLMLPLVLSVKPVTEVSLGSGNGYQIEFPPYTVGKISTAFEMPFHIFNLSNGLKIIDASCSLHIMNGEGVHIYENNSVTSIGDGEYVFSLNDTIFSITGWYSFTAYCNSSTLGGFVTHPFQITGDGIEINCDSGWYPILICMFIICMLLYLAYKVDDNLMFVFLLGATIFVPVILRLSVLQMLYVGGDASSIIVMNLIFTLSLIFVFCMFAYVFIQTFMKLKVRKDAEFRFTDTPLGRAKKTSADRKANKKKYKR